GVTARKDGGEVGQGVEVVDVAQLMLQSIARVESSVLTENLKVVQQPKVEEPEPVSEPEPAAHASNGFAPEGNGAVLHSDVKPVGLGFKSGMKAPGRKS
ncbi:hypothetical protein, partial [Nocardia sp. SYP-A9097]|uniref:hypothetical protein n=1 Tax=Nocardia sp. SYP-A9097 TaxID=2663237 RepID=UPI001890D0BB